MPPRQCGSAPGPHPAADTLAAFADGLLTDEQTVAVGDHLRGCRSCLQHAITLRELLTTPDDAPVPAHLERRALAAFIPSPKQAPRRA